MAVRRSMEAALPFLVGLTANAMTTQPHCSLAPRFASSLQTRSQGCGVDRKRGDQPCAALFQGPARLEQPVTSILKVHWISLSVIPGLRTRLHSFIPGSRGLVLVRWTSPCSLVQALLSWKVQDVKSLQSISSSPYVLVCRVCGASIRARSTASSDQHECTLRTFRGIRSRDIRKLRSESGVVIDARSTGSCLRDGAGGAYSFCPGMQVDSRMQSEHPA